MFWPQSRSKQSIRGHKRSRVTRLWTPHSQSCRFLSSKHCRLLFIIMPAPLKFHPLLKLLTMHLKIETITKTSVSHVNCRAGQKSHYFVVHPYHSFRLISFLQYWTKKPSLVQPWETVFSEKVRRKLPQLAMLTLHHCTPPLSPTANYHMHIVHCLYIIVYIQMLSHLCMPPVYFWAPDQN